MRATTIDVDAQNGRAAGPFAAVVAGGKRVAVPLGRPMAWFCHAPTADMATLIYFCNIDKLAMGKQASILIIAKVEKLCTKSLFCEKYGGVTRELIFVQD
jgi:hypothetical protein